MYEDLVVQARLLDLQLRTGAWKHDELSPRVVSRFAYHQQHAASPPRALLPWRSKHARHPLVALCSATGATWRCGSGGRVSTAE